MEAISCMGEIDRRTFVKLSGVSAAALILGAFDVPAGGSYDVSAFLTKAPDYGSYTLAIDGKQVGAFDGYAPTVSRAGPVPLGGVGLRKGRHEITLTVTGKNPAASNYYAGLDVLTLARSGKA